MVVWIANKLGAPNPTFIKYRNTLESYEKFSRAGEGIYSFGILQFLFLSRLLRCYLGKICTKPCAHTQTTYRYQ